LSPEEVVRAELNAWGRRDVDEIVSHFSDDAVWENVPLGAANGHGEIRYLVKQYVDRISQFDCDIANLATAGNVVLTERVDHFVFDGTPMYARCMGAFEVRGDKISAWRDYFETHH
jgi:limonene-1,2-epoxide hydrolase